MKLGVRVKCGYKCRGREGFCPKCKDAVPLPSIAAAAMTIADTGSEEDLMSHSDLEVHFKDKAKKIPSSPVSLITANGPVDAETKHEVYNEALMNSPQFVELPSTPAVCSVGKKCMEQGFSFHWPTGEAPYFICPNGQKVQYQLRGYVPVFGDRGPLISCPAIPFGAKVLYWAPKKQKKPERSKFAGAGIEGIFLGYYIQPGFIFNDEYLVAPLLQMLWRMRACECEAPGASRRGVSM